MVRCHQLPPILLHEPSCEAAAGPGGTLNSAQIFSGSRAAVRILASFNEARVISAVSDTQLYRR